MQAQISLLIDQQPGSLFRVVTALRRFGLRFHDEDLDASPVDQGYSVNLRVDGATVPTIEITDQLKGLRGVTRVRDVRRVLSPLVQGAGLVSVRSPDTDVDSASHKSAPDTTDADNGTASVETRRRQEAAERIDAMMAAYPAIATSVFGYIHSVESVAESDALVRNFGLRCGRRMASVEGRFIHAQGLDETLDKVIRGFLFPIARLRISEQTIRYDETLFSQAAREQDADARTRAMTCQFIAGLIEGMLNHAPGLPDLRVHETSCIHRGHRRCELVIEEAQA